MTIPAGAKMEHAPVTEQVKEFTHRIFREFRTLDQRYQDVADALADLVRQERLEEAKWFANEDGLLRHRLTKEIQRHLLALSAPSEAQG